MPTNQHHAEHPVTSPEDRILELAQNKGLEQVLAYELFKLEQLRQEALRKSWGAVECLARFENELLGIIEGMPSKK